MGVEHHYPGNLVLAELKKLTTLMEKILALQVKNTETDRTNDPYITIKESINLLKISRSTINRYLKMNVLWGKKVNGRVLVCKKSIDDLLNKSHSLSKKGDTL